MVEGSITNDGKTPISFRECLVGAWSHASFKEEVRASEVVVDDLFDVPDGRIPGGSGGRGGSNHCEV